MCHANIQKMRLHFYIRDSKNVSKLPNWEAPFLHSIEHRVLILFLVMHTDRLRHWIMFTDSSYCNAHNIIANDKRLATTLNSATVTCMLTTVLECTSPHNARHDHEILTTPMTVFTTLFTCAYHLCLQTSTPSSSSWSSAINDSAIYHLYYHIAIPIYLSTILSLRIIANLSNSCKYRLWLNVLNLEACTCCLHANERQLSWDRDIWRNGGVTCTCYVYLAYQYIRINLCEALWNFIQCCE